MSVKEINLKRKLFLDHIIEKYVGEKYYQPHN